jgi:hypothetical protein
MLETERPNMPDVTSEIRADFEWLLTSELRRKLTDAFVDGQPVPCGTGRCSECNKVFECAKILDLSPEMAKALDDFAALQDDRMTCVRTET